MSSTFCPYGIFGTDTGGDVRVGYRKHPDGDRQKVQALLDMFVKKVVSDETPQNPCQIKPCMSE